MYKTSNEFMESLVLKTPNELLLNLTPPNNDPYFTDIVNSGDYPTFQENIPGGSVIGVYSASDSDGDNLTFSITGGADQSYFEIETMKNTEKILKHELS